METPPPFNPPSYAPPPKKRGPGLVIAIIVIALLICCGGPLLLLGGAGLWGYQKFGSLITCAISISETRKAILEYEKEKGHFPPAATWQTDIAPYYKSVIESRKSKEDRGPFKAWNIDENLICTDNPTPTGIAYNEELAGKKLSDIKDPYSTYVLFEVGETGMNLHQAYKRRDRSTWPKMMDSRRPWLELKLRGDVEGGDSKTIQIKTSSNDDSSDADPMDPPKTPSKGGKATSNDSDLN